MWRFSLSEIEISTKRGRVKFSPIFPKIFWRYYNDGWRIASETRFKLLAEVQVPTLDESVGTNGNLY